jgi:histone deacetylase 1/2
MERCHRHIVETGLTFLGQCSAPFWFWNYAFKSSIYLINRIPTPVLQNKSLFECLFHCTPNYNFLRIFGCLFSIFASIHAHKLDFCYSPCVFLGYNSSHLGYRCLDLASHHIYVSRHVRFCENIFPFVNSDTFTSTLPTAYTPSTPESSLTLLAYHFTN